MKSLQLRERRQIAEPRKYCLVRVIFFLWSLLFLFLIGWEFGLIPYTSNEVYEKQNFNSVLTLIRDYVFRLSFLTTLNI